MQNIQFFKGVIDAPGCISNGWNLLKPNYWMYFGIAIIAMILAGCIPCISLFLVGPVLGGVYFVILREMRGEPVEFGMMFKGFEKFVPLMVIGIVQSIPEIIGQILRITVDLGRLGLTGGGGRGNGNFFQSSDAAPLLAGGLLILAIVVGLVFLVIGITWRVLLFFAIPLAMEHDLGPVDAMKLSGKGCDVECRRSDRIVYPRNSRCASGRVDALYRHFLCHSNFIRRERICLQTGFPDAESDISTGTAIGRLPRELWARNVSLQIELHEEYAFIWVIVIRLDNGKAMRFIEFHGFSHFRWVRVEAHLQISDHSRFIDQLFDHRFAEPESAKIFA